MRAKCYVICVLVLMLILISTSTWGEPTPGKPKVDPKDAEAKPGEKFELKVAITANVNGTHRVTFIERTQFSFPDLKYQEHNLTKGDAILFKVNCKVNDDTPDGDFNITFKVKWEYNGTSNDYSDTLRVTVGEGADEDKDKGTGCESAWIISSIGILAFSILLIKRRKH